MFKKLAVMISVFLFLAICAAPLMAQKDEEALIAGVVEEVAEDGSFVVVNGQTMMIDADIADSMDMEVGDEVELTTEIVDEETIVVDFNYI